MFLGNPYPVPPKWGESRIVPFWLSKGVKNIHYYSWGVLFYWIAHDAIQTFYYWIEPVNYSRNRNINICMLTHFWARNYCLPGPSEKLPNPTEITVILVPKPWTTSWQAAGSKNANAFVCELWLVKKFALIYNSPLWNALINNSPLWSAPKVSNGFQLLANCYETPLLLIRPYPPLYAVKRPYIPETPLPALNCPETPLFATRTKINNSHHIITLPHNRLITTWLSLEWQE